MTACTQNATPEDQEHSSDETSAAFQQMLDEYYEEDLKLNPLKAILKWECEISLDRLQFREDLQPIDQMWSVNLIIGQLASGASAQPFKTVEDYRNWIAANQ